MGSAPPLSWIPSGFLQGSRCSPGSYGCITEVGIWGSGRGHRRGENEHCAIRISLQSCCWGLRNFRNWTSAPPCLQFNYPSPRACHMKNACAWICISLLDDVISISFTPSQSTVKHGDLYFLFYLTHLSLWPDSFSRQWFRWNFLLFWISCMHYPFIP